MVNERVFKTHSINLRLKISFFSYDKSGCPVEFGTTFLKILRSCLSRRSYTLTGIAPHGRRGLAHGLFPDGKVYYHTKYFYET